MIDFNTPFTDKDYIDYKRANYKHYDDRKIQGLHSRVFEQIEELNTINELDHYVRRKMIWILDWLNKAEIPYENKYKHEPIKFIYCERKIESSQPIKKKRWWKLWNTP